MKKGLGLQLKLGIFIFLLITSVVVSLTIVTTTKQTSGLQQQLMEKGKMVVATFVPVAEQAIQTGKYDNLRQCYQKLLKASTDVRYVVLVKSTGLAVAHSDKTRENRLFNDAVGIKAAQTQDTLTQLYKRDTGEELYDISMPVYYKGEHWGAVRLGIPTAVVANLKNSTVKAIAIIAVILIIVSLLISYVFVRTFINPIKTLVQKIKSLAEQGGDLTQRMEVKSKDEIGELSTWFNLFMDKLHDIISQVKQSSNLVATAANETSMGNQDLSQRTEEQASSLEEISSTIEEVTASLHNSTESANDADSNSKATLQIVVKGEEVVNELYVAMQEITKGSHEIAEIIAKVNDIAFQTNLLALNAAVEAARAGEQGRGFAVVAAEVRNLAGRTAESAKEVEGLIKESISKVERGNELMEQTATVLSDIVTNTQKTTEVITEIASTTREQSAAAGDIKTAVEQLNQVTQQNASLVEEIAGSSETVSNEAEELSALVGKFKVNEASAHSRESSLAHEAHENHSCDGIESQISKGGKQGRTNTTVKPRAAFNEGDFEKF